MNDYKLAIIGGSGLYEIEDIEESQWEKWKSILTSVLVT